MLNIICEGKIFYRYLDKAKENFYWLRTENGETCQEFEELLSNDEEDVPHLDAGLVSEICSKPFIKSALIASLAVTADNVAGFDSIGAYSETIITDMSPKLNARWGTVLIYGVSVLSCALSCVLIERFPRRFLYFTSGVGILLSLIAIVVILAWNLPKYLLIVFLCAYQAAGYFGVMTIPWLLTGEVMSVISIIVLARWIRLYSIYLARLRYTRFRSVWPYYSFCAFLL